jgi:hypothetical protein
VTDIYKTFVILYRTATVKEGDSSVCGGKFVFNSYRKVANQEEKKLTFTNEPSRELTKRKGCTTYVWAFMSHILIQHVEHFGKKLYVSFNYVFMYEFIGKEPKILIMHSKHLVPNSITFWGNRDSLVGIATGWNAGVR